MSSNVVFAVGTGRCGTKFLHKIFSKESEVASFHERHPLSDTFHRYCKWYDLPVDHAGFLHTKRTAIEQDLHQKRFYFEASAFLSLSVKELYEEFEGRFILLIRTPERVINSYIRKGWYDHPVVINDNHKLPSYQQSKEFHHFLGRTLPRGEELERWKTLTRVGKLAWFWNTLNREVYRQFAEIPPAKTMIVRLEDLDYEKYTQQISTFIGFTPSLSADAFAVLAEEKPNAFDGVQTISVWNDREKNEFINEVTEMAAVFDYDPVAIINMAKAGPTNIQNSQTLDKRNSLRSFFSNFLKT